MVFKPRGLGQPRVDLVDVAGSAKPPTSPRAGWSQRRTASVKHGQNMFHPFIQRPLDPIAQLLHDTSASIRAQFAGLVSSCATSLTTSDRRPLFSVAHEEQDATMLDNKQHRQHDYPTLFPSHIHETPHPLRAKQPFRWVAKAASPCPCRPL